MARSDQFAPDLEVLLPGFDHGIFYTVEGGRIIVSAVLDLRRDPTFIRSRLAL